MSWRCSGLDSPASACGARFCWTAPAMWRRAGASTPIRTRSSPTISASCARSWPRASARDKSRRHRRSPPPYWSPVDEVRVVVAHSERATLQVGDVFLKVDADQARIDREVEVMTLAPVTTPEILWHKPHVLAIAAVPGTVLGRL